jgi:mono/diheme cytochrome c family protein
MVRAAVVLSARDVFPQSQLSRRLPSGFLVLAFLLLVPAVISAQEKNPFAGDAKAAKLGESQFRINCAFCHGLGARGGGRGPDLTQAQKKHGNRRRALSHDQ